MKPDQILRVFRDSDDLGLDAGTLLRVARVHGRTMDVETLDCEIMIAGVACDHADLARVSSDPLDRYRSCVVPQLKVSIAESLIAYWDRPWSGTAKRFAYHALRVALSRGLDVLEA